MLARFISLIGSTPFPGAGRLSNFDAGKSLPS